MDRFAYFKPHQLTVVANMAVTTTCEVILWSTVLSAYADPYADDGEFDSSRALGFAFVVVPSLALYSLTMIIVAAVFLSDPGVLARNRGRDPESALSAEVISEDLESGTRERLQAALDAVPHSSRTRMLSMDDTRAQLKSYEVDQASAKAFAQAAASGGDSSAAAGGPADGDAGTASPAWVVIDPGVAWRDARGTPMLMDGSKWCRTCLVWRPAGASHCGEIGRCVKQFDHYCPAVGTAVGGGNHVLFSWMTVAAAGLVVHGLACAVGHLAWLFVRSWTFTGLWTSEALNLSTEAIAVALILVLIIRPMGTPCCRPFWRHTLFVLLPNSLVLMGVLGSVLLAVVYAPVMAATFRSLVDVALKPRFTDLSGGANGTVPSVVAAAEDAAKQARASAVVLATEYGPSGTAEALDGPWGSVFMGAAVTLLWCCSRVVMASCSSPLSGITGSGAAVMCGPCAPLATALGCCPGGAFASDATAMISEVLSSVVCWGAALCVLMPRWWNFDPTGKYETEPQSWEGPWVLLAIAVGAALSMMMVPFAINHWHLVSTGKTTKGLSVGNPFRGTRWPLALWRAALDGAATAAAAAGIGSGLEGAHSHGDARQRAGRDLGAGV
ncbi:hypothetical protein FNF29_01167 [Cafeteria roenbergensis]|uniref:Palmitoyltransferase n=1 Tax=Cafeteria roenbergensis TaxID=33653 RepID=A0A5A8CVA1_CAFRO|nr:hypothetical protein FNF29_01167 [Cafeteria roenbergensis]|eukprot:KAA0156374.1 hypothetical protein FNF29_01167 [Cafeteria roenbergensis]